MKLASDLAVRDTSYRAEFRRYHDRVVALAPRRPEAYLITGEFAFREGDVAEGQHQFEAAAHLNPALPVPYWVLGSELLKAGRPREAQPFVEEALSRGFEYRSAPGLTTLIRMYHAVGDSARAAHYVAVARVVAPSVLDSTIAQ